MKRFDHDESEIATVFPRAFQHIRVVINHELIISKNISAAQWDAYRHNTLLNVKEIIFPKRLDIHMTIWEEHGCPKIDDVELSSFFDG